MTWKNRARAAGLACAAMAGCSQIAIAATPTDTKDDTAAMFGAREAVVAPTLSPDGSKVLYLTADSASGTAVMVADVDGSSAPHTVTATQSATTSFYGCDWADNSRIVCTIVGNSETDALTSVRRLIAVDAAGGRPVTLSLSATAGRGQLRLSTNGGEVIDWLTGANGKLLIERDHVPEENIGTRVAHTENGLGVDLVDTRSLGASTVEPAEQNVSTFMSDGKGKVRLMAHYDTIGGGYFNGRMAGGRKWLYRTSGSRQWRAFSETGGNAAGVEPLAIDASTDSAYGTAVKDGRQALYRIALDGSMKTDLVYADPRVDVDDVVRLGRQARLIGYTTDTEKRAITYFDPKDAALARALSKALPNLPIVEFVSASADEGKLLLFAGSDVDPGRYYVFDRATKHLNEIALVRPQLEHATLGAMTPITYKAADGTTIPAYLTLPPGGAKTGLPAIVMPHGGPAARDDWGFDWLVQFYASRGYAVLQPEYRGSAGFGGDWRGSNAFHNWRQAVSDIDDAGRWLISQHIADASRLAIVGWSYGGYAALQSQVVDPDLFKAVIATAPVTDFAMLKAEANRVVYDATIGAELKLSNAGLRSAEIGEGPEVAAGSPLQHVAAFKAPVMMFHGTLDRNVSVEETRAMNDRLRAAGKQSTAIIYPGVDHALRDGELRADMLRRSDAFLREALHIAG